MNAKIGKYSPRVNFFFSCYLAFTVALSLLLVKRVQHTQTNTNILLVKRGPPYPDKYEYFAF